MREVKKIVIIGPESTGKSTLCRELATHYSTLWCPEYAREYLLKNGKGYNYDDLLEIAKGQCALEDEMFAKVSGESQKSKVKSQSRDSTLKLMPRSSYLKPQIPSLFIDTNLYVMKVWCEFVFKKCHQYILDEIATRKYDLYLICNIDLPWVEDEFREYPDIESREKLYRIYKDILINQEVPWTEISGNYSERLAGAIKAIDSFTSSERS